MNIFIPQTPEHMKERYQAEVQLYLKFSASVYRVQGSNKTVESRLINDDHNKL